MDWRKDEIRGFLRKYCLLAIFSVAVGLIFFISINYLQGSFIWREYNLIPEPDLPARLLSALVFMSFGWILYELKFYYFLYFILVIILRDKRLYNKSKRAIWDLMTFFMGTYVAPWIVDLLNKLLSIFCNIIALIAYLIQPIGMSSVLALAIIYYETRQVRNVQMIKSHVMTKHDNF